MTTTAKKALWRQMLDARMNAGPLLPLQIAEELRVVLEYLEQRQDDCTAALRIEAYRARWAEIPPGSQLQKGGVLVLTADQNEAVEGILAEVQNEDACPVLCGYAGTGKTVTTAALVTRLVDQDLRVVVATPTHKARAQVERALRERGAYGFQVVTVHRLLGLKQVRDKQTGKESFAPDPGGKNMLTEEEKWDNHLHKMQPVHRIDVVIVDETSMLSSELYDLLRREAAGKPVVFVGDDRQLLPVGEDQACRAFTEASEVFRLTQVLRHDGAILNLATATRELPAGRARFASAEGGGTRVIAHRRREDWTRTLLEMAASEEAMRDADFCRALAFTNKAVDEINLRIHQRRYGMDAPQFVEGMTCVTVDAIPDPEGGSPLLNSTVDVLVEKARRDSFMCNGDKEPCELWDCWELTVSVPGERLAPVTFHVLATEERQRWDAAMRKIADEAKGASGEERSKLWGVYFHRKDSVGRLQPASALTIHKSQGSTFRNVWLHWSIDGWGSAPTAQQNQLAYVGITRAAESLHVVGDR
ncbi:MAG: AAA family ATPase [Cyanobacteriota bacterium]|nr:AAA family ATPase [Cyanobacteriota bacterium]